MLLDDLMAERTRPPVEVVMPPVLTVEPVAVPPAGEVGRRAARQRLLELEDAARRNFRSAEEARRVLAEEHRRLEQESSARTDAEREASALRRELERLRESEEQRNARAKTRASRQAHSEMADEIARIQEQHDRVLAELDTVRRSIGERDSLLEEYGARLREEQQARVALRVELERAEAARELAERSLTRATEDARRRAEDEIIHVASTESALADKLSDREREITRLEKTINELTVRLDEAETAEANSAGNPPVELEAALQAAEDRAREAERQQGRMRRESSEIAKARRIAEEALHANAQELDLLRPRLAEAEAELVRARADGDRLRAHAAALGDELAALRESVVVLQSAAPAPPAPPAPPAVEELASVDGPASVNDIEPPPLEPPPLERRRPAPVEAAQPGVRRHAMAELTAIAATMGDDDFTPRRR